MAFTWPESGLKAPAPLPLAALLCACALAQPGLFSLVGGIGALLAQAAGPWAYCLLASLLVAFCGILPLFILDPAIVVSEAGKPSGIGAVFLHFAAGSLLGDVFLHLLPETWHVLRDGHTGATLLTAGGWVIAGLVAFTALERLLAATAEEGSATGYLNLAVNAVDNFAHGLTIGGSFLAGTCVGVTTTLGILIHEIPHEIGDFAILLRSGFSRWEAAKGQLATAACGLAGSLAALSLETHALERTWWVLPFTAGGFLSVALVNLIPELVAAGAKEEAMRGSGSALRRGMLDLGALASGIGLMGAFSYLHAH